MKLKYVLLLSSLAVLPACSSYTVLRYDTSTTATQLSATMPRTPIRLTYRSEHPNNVRSQGIHNTLNTHPFVMLSNDADVDVIVTFNGIDCHKNWLVMDSPAAIVSGLLLPIVLVANPFANQDTDCDIKLGYSLPRVNGGTQKTMPVYRYNSRQQTQSLLRPLYTSDARTTYQAEHMYDQVVARLLLSIQNDLRGDVW